MAKEKFDFDDDLNDFNIGDDFGDPYTPKETGSGSNSRTPVTKAGKSLLTGAAQETKNPGLYKNILKAALPESFTVTLDNIDTVTDIGQRTYSQAMREARPMMTQVRKVAGSINRIVPSPFQSKIDNYLKSKDKKDLSNIDIDMEEASVQQGIGDIFTEQEQDDRKTEQAEKLLEYVSEKDYRKNLLTQLGSINRQLALQTENQLRVQRAWQHKSLELQLRQLFVSRRTMEITKQGMEENSMLLRDVVKNTALPDIQKEQKSETLTRLTRERLFGMAQGRVADWASQNRYLRAVGQRLQSAVKNKVNEMQFGFQAAADMFDSVEEQLKAAKEYGIDTSQMAGELAGGSLANRLGSWLGKKVGKRLGADRLDKTFRTLNNRFGRVAQTGVTLGRRWKRSNNRLAQFAGDILDVPFQQDSTVATGHLASLDADPGRMNVENRKLQALEITLPGLLSRILQSSEGIRTGVVPDRLVLDPQRGTFMTLKDSTSNMVQRVLSDDTIVNAQSNLNDLVKGVSGGKLSRKDQQELGKFLRDKSRDHTWAFSPESLLDSGNGLSERLRNRLGDSLSSRYGVVYDHEKGKWKTPISGLNGIRSLERDARSYNSFRDYSADVYRNVKAIHSLGGIEQLLKAGVVRWDDRSQTYELDPEYVERRSNVKFKKIQRHGNVPVEPEVGSGFIGPWVSNDSNGTGGTSPKPMGAPIGGTEDTEQKSRLAQLFSSSRGQGGNKAVIQAIRDQTASMLDAFEKMPIRDVQEEQADYLADILERLETGVGTFGNGESPRKPGLIRRGVGFAGRTARGVWKATGYPFKIMKAVAKKALAPFNFIKSKIFDRVKKIGSWGVDKATALVTDVYVKGQDGLRRAIERGLMIAGKYTDVNTGKIISSIKDITGPVINNETGEMVLTQEDFDGGLLNSLGVKLKTGIIAGIKNAAKKGIGFIASPITKPLAWAKSGINFVKKLMLTPPDVYLQGQMDRPVLYGQQMYNGMYWSATTNKVVRYIGDIDGDIYTWDRGTMQKRIVLTAQQIQDPGLVDFSGKPLKGFMKKWKERISSAAGFIAKNLNPLTWIRKGTDLAKKGLGIIASPFTAAGRAIGGDWGNSWTKRIYRLLWNKFNGLPLESGLKNAATELGGKTASVGSKVKNWWGNRKGFNLKDKFTNSKLGGLLSSLFTGIKGFNRKDQPRKSTLKDRLDELKNREGSWVNRLAESAGKAKTSVKDHLKKAKGVPWLNLIMSGFGIVSMAIKSFKDKFLGWGSTLFKWLPKVLAAIRDTKLAQSGMDLAGSLLGGGKGGLVKKAGKGIWKAGKWIGSAALGAVRHPLKATGTIAKYAGKAAMFGLRAIPLLAEGALAVLTSPVTWAAAAAVGAGYLIYKGYKAYQGRITSVREMRLAQYGFAKGDDSDKLGKVLALEEACLKVVKWDSNGVPSLGPLKYPELIQAFDIPLTAEKSVMSWANWFAERFRPVFLKNIQEIHRRDEKATILDPNTSLPKGALPSYALATRLPDKAPNGDKGPYYVEWSPFQNHSCIIGTDLVDSTIQKVVVEYASDAKKYKVEERNKAGLANAQNIVLTPKAGKEMAPGLQLEKTDQVYGPGDVKANIGRITGDPDKDMKIIQGNMIDDVTAIRMKLYGMRELSKSQVNLIWRMEDSLLKDGTIAVRNKLATFTGDKNKIVQEWAPVFGVSLGAAADVADWQFWFERRFLPVFLNFVTRGSKWLGTDNLLNKVRTAHPEIQYSVAEFMSIAKTEVNGQSTSVWSVNAYPFPMESANTDSLSITGNMDSLRKRIKDAKYTEALVKKNPKLKYDKDGKPLSDSDLMKKIASTPGSLLPTNAINAALLAQQGGTSPLTGGGGLTSFDMSKYSSVDDMTPNGGKAGDLPKVDGAAVAAAKDPARRYAMLKPLFEAVSKMIGVDVPTLTAFAMQESTFNPLAKARGSSATGLFQFIDKTWESYAGKLKAFGFSNPQQTDPLANTVAGAMFIRDNIQALKPVVGRMPNIPELYLAHFLGPGGAKKVLSQPDNASIMTGVNGDQVRANQGVFKDISTIADIKNWAARMMQKGIDFTSKYAGPAVPNQATYTTNTGSSYGQEAGSLANAAQMGTPSVPATAPEITLPGSGPVAASNQDAVSGDLRKVKASSPVADSPTKASPVAVARDDVENQRRVQNEKVADKVHAARTSTETTNRRTQATTDQITQMRKTHSVQEDIRDATQGAQKLLEEIRNILSAQTGTGEPDSGPTNFNAEKENMLLKNASRNPPVGQKNVTRPFNTARKSA